MQRSVVDPWTWQERFGFVHANVVSASSRTLFIAGQTSVAEDGTPCHAGDMARQIERSFDNLETVLAAAGATLADVARLNYYTTDVDRLLREWSTVTARLSRAGCRPASTLLGVARLSSPVFLIEIEATAAV